MGDAGGAGGDRRRAPDPGRRRRDHQVPASRRSPPRTCTPPARPAPAPLGRPDHRRADRRRRHLDRLPHLGAPSPAPSAALRGASRAGCTPSCYNKWYFDELIDLLVVRPTQWLGRFTDSVLERGVIAGGGHRRHHRRSSRAGSAAVRRAQTGFLRYYAAVDGRRHLGRGPLLPDLRDHDALDPHLAPARARRWSARCCPRGWPAAPPRSWSLVTLGHRDLVPGALQDAGTPACSSSPTRCGSPRWGSTTSSGSTGSTSRW